MTCTVRAQANGNKLLAVLPLLTPVGCNPDAPGEREGRRHHVAQDGDGWGSGLSDDQGDEPRSDDRHCIESLVRVPSYQAATDTQEVPGHRSALASLQ